VETESGAPNRLVPKLPLAHFLICSCLFALDSSWMISVSADGTDRLEPIWKATTSPQPVGRALSFTPGAPSPGVLETRPLSQPLAPGAFYEFVVHLPGEVAIEFRPRDLRPGQLRVEPSGFGNHRWVSPAEFASVNTSECRVR
jgi:hypothetical protein